MKDFIPRKVQLSVAAQQDRHREHPDPVPLEVPGHQEGPRTIAELVEAEVARLLSASGRDVVQAPDPADDVMSDEELEQLLDEDGFGMSVHQLVAMQDDVDLENRQRAAEEAAIAETGGEEPPGRTDGEPVPLDDVGTGSEQ